MRGLNSREKILLGACFFVVFVVLNFFGVKWAVGALGGSDAKIKELKSTLADHEMWLQNDADWATRNEWIAAKMPVLDGNAIGKAQGDLLQQLQDDLFQRKITIDRQTLQETKNEVDYREVSVKLDLRGEASVVIDWLSTLQGPEKFVVVKDIELELDTKSKELEPQAKCQIVVANWYRPEVTDLPDAPPIEQTTPPATEPIDPPVTEEPPVVPTTTPPVESENTEATNTSKKEVAFLDSTVFNR